MRKTILLVHVSPTSPRQSNGICSNRQLDTAEFANSITNGLFVLLGIKGILNCIREGHDSVFLITFVGYLLIGLGSLAFHSTLWCKAVRTLATTKLTHEDSMQLVDELSMINTTLMMYFATFAYGKSTGYSIFIASGLIGIAVTITYVYHYLQEPKFHQNAYAVLTSIVLGRSVYLMETRLRATDVKAVKQLWQLVGWGFFNFGLGFLLWTGDRFFCDQLIAARRYIGLPWGFLLGESRKHRM